MKKVIDINEIKKLIPHRYPFLLVDAIESITPMESIVGVKNVTINEPFFGGHFPEKPVMPGVLMIEALAQTSGLLILKSLETEYQEGNLFLLASVDKARFKRIVEPGDQLKLHVEVLVKKAKLWKFKGQAFVDGELACEAEFMNIRG